MALPGQFPTPKRRAASATSLRAPASHRACMRKRESTPGPRARICGKAHRGDGVGAQLRVGSRANFDVGLRIALGGTYIPAGSREVADLSQLCRSARPVLKSTIAMPPSASASMRSDLIRNVNDARSTVAVLRRLGPRTAAACVRSGAKHAEDARAVSLPPRELASVSCASELRETPESGFDGGFTTESRPPRARCRARGASHGRGQRRQNAGRCQVHQHATLLRRQTAERNRPGLRVESMAGDRLERAVALGGDDVGRSARRDASRRKSRSAVVDNGFGR